MSYYPDLSVNNNDNRVSHDSNANTVGAISRPLSGVHQSDPSIRSSRPRAPKHLRALPGDPSPSPSFNETLFCPSDACAGEGREEGTGRGGRAANNYEKGSYPVYLPREGGEGGEGALPTVERPLALVSAEELMYGTEGETFVQRAMDKYQWKDLFIGTKL
uniref:Uncharacterized protein n=1 Tax=Polytomella parva TaxID=51329 RepID=A0A7S0UYV6_9CHLO